MALPRLDVILGLTAPAVEVFVDPARRSRGEVGDDEARIGALRPGFDASVNALDARLLSADLAHQATQESARLGTGRTLGGAQHGGDRSSLGVETTIGRKPYAS
jgi:hypothetical protein